MEREGEGREEGKMRRGRGGVEIRKGIIVGGMILGLLMGCNNGGEELEKEKESILSISNLRQGFLDVFATFGDLLKDAFGVDANTTKKGVGEYLGKVGEAVGAVKGKLDTLKGSEQYNLIKDKADNVITNAIDALSKIVRGTIKIKEATKDASGQVANSKGTDNAEVANIESVKGLVEGINMIYEAATKDAKIDLKGYAEKKIADSAKVGGLFNQTGNANDAKALKGANRAVNTASGADILAAIAAAKGKVSNGTAGEINAAKDAFDIAAASKSHNDLTTINTNASVIAAGLALKAMAKDGKLATDTSNNPAEELNAVLIGAVDKTVNEILSTIRRTVDKCLKNVSDCIKEDSSSIAKSSK